MTEANIFQNNTQNPVTNYNTTSHLVVPKTKTINRIYGRHDVLDGDYRLSQKIIAEVIGTALFVFGVCGCCVFSDNPVNAVLGSSFMGGIIIYLFARVSGAHFNPAVSFALFLRQKLNCMEFGLYVAAQVVGAFIGCVFLALCRRGKFKEMAGTQIQDYLIYTAEGTKKNAWCYISALICETLMTFILIMFILASCERDNYLGPSLGLAFSATLISMNVLGGNITGCSLNPARSLAPAMIQWWAGGDKDPIKQIWIYIVGPFLGALIAAFVWPIFIFQ
jgi:aquaporin Z